jgi:hypothetical protein
MDAKLKKQWVQALRSGDYKQGQNGLRVDEGDGPRFCCLGVLADLIDPDGWFDGRNAFSGECEIRHQLGEAEQPGGYLKRRLLHKSTQLSLSNKNDEGASFDEIADYIEKWIKAS